MVKQIPILGATWFLEVLFYATIFYSVLRKFIKISVLISLTSVICLLIGLKTNFPGHLSVVLVSTFYLHIGYLYRNVWPLKHFEKCILSVVLLSATAYVSIFFQSSYVTNHYTNSFYSVPIALAGSFGVITMCQIIEKANALEGITKLLLWIGRNTLGPLIWQFLSFKLVIIFQIFVYGQPWELLQSFPVVYSYAHGIWVVLDVFVGILFSYFFQNIINNMVQ